jgi:Ca-activated chloride channel homolog
MPISLPAAPDRSRLPTPPDLRTPPAAGAEVVTADGRSLPLVSATLRGTACGGLARLVLEQRFENRHAETLHVTYRMPLPADAAVSGYAFVIADRTIAGRVQRKHEARERFERAIAAGHTAALLEQERSDIFTQSIGNLPARETLVARIVIDQRLVWLPEGEWELRFPTVIGPRYVGAADPAEDARATRVTTTAAGVAARVQIQIAIDDTLSPGRAPASPSHALTVCDDGVIEFGDIAGARLDRDIVLRWPVAGPTTGMTLAMMRPEHGDDCYGLVTIVPPAPSARPRTLARDLIVLIDTSGSMAGEPLAKAKQVVALLIESLGDADRLELIAFSSQPRPYRPAPVTATRDEKQAALRWLRGLSADGGTEMRTAVVAALEQLRPGAQRQVVIATDGYIGGEQGLVAALHAGLPASCRLHFVGVGSSVNRSLAVAMARAGRGAEVICDLGDDAERAVKRLLDRTRAPLLTDLELTGSALIAQAPAALPDVFAGAPLVAAVKLRGGELVVRGQTGDGDWSCRLRVATPRLGDGSPAIAALFGRERVADLEARGFAGEDHDAEIERTGLAFQIATRLTPFIAVDDSRTVKPAQRHEAVPQELPHGTTAAAFGLRGPSPIVERAIKTQAGTLVTGLAPPAAFRNPEMTLLGEFEPDLATFSGEEDEREIAPPPAPAQPVPTRGLRMRTQAYTLGAEPPDDPAVPRDVAPPPAFPEIKIVMMAGGGSQPPAPSKVEPMVSAGMPPEPREMTKGRATPGLDAMASRTGDAMPVPLAGRSVWRRWWVMMILLIAAGLAALAWWWLVG